MFAWLDDGRALAGLLGAAVTAGSLLFSIWSYRRSQEQQLFSRFRPDFANLKVELRRLDHFISEIEGQEVAQNIASTIIELFPDEETARQRLPEFGSTQDEKNALITSVYSGWHKSKTPRSVREISATFSRFVNTYKGHFPVLMNLVEAVTFYPIRSAEAFTSPQLVIEALKDDDFRRQAFGSVVADSATYPLRTELAVMVAMLPMQHAEEVGQRVFTQATDLLKVIERAVSAHPDAQLSALARRDRRIAVKKLRPFDDTTDGFKEAIDDITHNLHLARRYFSRRQWSRLSQLREELAAALQPAAN